MYLGKQTDKHTVGFHDLQIQFFPVVLQRQTKHGEKGVEKIIKARVAEIRVAASPNASGVDRTLPGSIFTVALISFSINFGSQSVFEAGV